jgi:hypothetical protein
MNESPLIPIVYVDPGDTDAKGLFSPAKSAAGKIGAVDSSQLADNLSAVCAKLSHVFRAAQSATEGFELQSFEVAVEITAGAEVRLVGSVSAQVQGGVKLIFERTPPAPAE